MGNQIPINLLSPFIVKVPGFVLLFGGRIFETQLTNYNILAFNISSFSWSILDAEIKAYPNLLMLDIQVDYFEPSGNAKTTQS